MNQTSEQMEAKIERVLRAVGRGQTVATACRREKWNSKHFFRAINRRPARLEQYNAIRGKKVDRPSDVPDFLTFRKRYFNRDTPAHQLEWWDAMQDSDQVLILVPPRGGKTTFMEDYVIWRICADRNVKILFICKNQDTAKDRLWKIKRLLTAESEYEDTEGNLIEDYGPFKPPRESELPWAAQMIYVLGTNASGRDPTLEAVGLGNNIQGNRTDVAVLDDTFTLENQLSASERKKQMNWYTQTVLTRRSANNRPLKVVGIGTRANPVDNFAVLLDDHTTRSVVQPAIIDEEKGLVLWPEALPLEEIQEVRETMSSKGNEAGFLLTYQQQATDLPDAPFKLDILEDAKSYDPDYQFGIVPRDHFVVMGVDFAPVGTCAIVVLAVSKKEKRRIVLDCITASKLTSNDRIKQFVFDACGIYSPKECRVEVTSWQAGMVNDEDFRRFFPQNGIRLTHIDTQKHNKFDPEVGVTIVASRFEAGQYVIPWNNNTKSRFQPLLEELATWRAELGRRQTQDRVMAFWLAERAAMSVGRQSGFKPPPDRGVNPRTLARAHEFGRPGVISLRERRERSIA